ncbi:MAG: transcription elongation factor GreA [Candidatus Cloacimonetes bacterium]|nr:transcription elongation factor GreA [Candidatus Cloacimonadota bacterium]
MKQLKRRMNYLALEERPVVVQQVVTARDHGDLKENAEYHAARERQRRIDNELSHLQRRLAKLQVVDTATIPKDAVRFGAFVTVHEMDKDIETVYRLVGVDEVDLPQENALAVSIASPIGKAMLGAKKGELFVVKAPAGDRKFKVINIE